MARGISGFPVGIFISEFTKFIQARWSIPCTNVVQGGLVDEGLGCAAYKRCRPDWEGVNARA